VIAGMAPGPTCALTRKVDHCALRRAAEGRSEGSPRERSRAAAR
jgi:hypothetical protein